MNGRDEMDAGVRVAGYRQMESLSASTLHALARAGLADVGDELKRRVLDRPEQEVCDVVETVDARQVSFKPFVELLLREIKFLARVPHVSQDDRRQRIGWAMTMAGV